MCSVSVLAACVFLVKGYWKKDACKMFMKFTTGPPKIVTPEACKISGDSWGLKVTAGSLSKLPRLLFFVKMCPSHRVEFETRTLLDRQGHGP